MIVTLKNIAHMIDLEAADPVCPIIARPEWFRNDWLDMIGFVMIYENNPAFT